MPLAVQCQQQRDVALCATVRVAVLGGRLGGVGGTALREGQRVLPVQRRRSKPFRVDFVRGHASGPQRCFGGFHHGLGAADKNFVQAGGGQQQRQQPVNLGRVDAALQQIHLLGLARQQMNQRQAVGVAVFEVLQRFVEHHAGHPLVAIHQREFSGRLLFQRSRNDRQNGRNARACSKSHTVHGTRPGADKTPLGRHRGQVTAGLELAGGPIGKYPAVHRADAYLEFAGSLVAASGATNRITSTYVLAVDLGPQC